MKPILFKTDMVRAIQDNRKTVTRRVVKQNHLRGLEAVNATVIEHSCTPPYHPGDILYVREAWTTLIGSYLYRANQKPGMKNPGKWRPSIHMPREAARIFLRVTDVRVEQLQDIRGGGIQAEGLEFDIERPVQSWRKFAELWDSTVKPADRAFYGVDANPWVWVIEFERISREEAVQNV